MYPIRRSDRQKDSFWALEVFDKVPYVTVSITRSDGTPYGVPLSLASKEEKTFYFHCVDEGEKLDCLGFNSIVSLSAVSKCTPKFDEGKRYTVL